MDSYGPNSAFESETFGVDLSFHIEQPVGSMSISPCARDVVLASKEGLHIIDLDFPFSPPRYLPHRTPWEVADVQWSPFAARDFWVISTSNQKALVWNLGIKSWQDPVEFVLHGHTRAITDINFSAHNPDVLATCAVDSFIHCWDLRVPARPVISFSDWFAGATQVKWSRQVSHVVASSHDKYLRIWDDRMGAYPVRSIQAHDTKIYGIDWNRQEQDRIVTCSLDKSIKFWDCNNLDDVPERTIKTPFPAWRARHTPFGWGLLAMPLRGNSDLHLYDRRSKNGQYTSGAVPAVASFEGHTGQVKEFLWRPRGTIIDGFDHREFQLVTWGTDQELRLHRIVPETMSAIGYEKGVTRVSGLKLTRSGAKYRTYRNEPSREFFDEVFDSQEGSSPAAGQSFHSRPRGSTSVGMSKVAIPHTQGWLQGSNITARIGMHGRTSARQIMNPIDWMKNVKITSWNPQTLGQEISQVGEKFDKVTFESVDVPQRRAVISMQSPWGRSNAPIFIKVDIKFPTGYPREAVAIFNVQKTAGMTDDLAKTLSTGLRTIAETYVASKRGCLEAVLRYLLREQDMEQIVEWIRDKSLEDSKIIEDVGFEEEVSSDEDDVGANNFQGPPGTTDPSELLNANMLVPVPIPCGAVWADNGKLVCFFPAPAEQTSSFLESFGIRKNEGDRSDKTFEGFGRLITDSPGARTTTRTATSREDLYSEFSVDSSYLSSSSSGSSDSLASLPTHFYPRNVWRAGGMGLQRSRSADHSTQSAIGVSNGRLAAESSTNVISIHDLSDLMPSKRELGMEYIIFGKGPDMCGYNADVAMRHGYEDIAHIWRLIQLILFDQVSLHSFVNLHGCSDILVMARSATDILKSNDSGVDLSYDEVMKRSKVVIPGRVRWGESALGSKYLVPALIRYFESLGDVQMLAMLSCVFAEPKASYPATVPSQEHHHDLSMQLKAPAFSVDYHPSLEVARAMIDKASTTSFASAKTVIKASDPYHVRLVGKIGHSNPTTPYSTGSTPPNPAQYLSHRPNNRRRSLRLSNAEGRDHNHCESTHTIHSGRISLSASPEDTRLTQRSSSNLTFSFSRLGTASLAPSLPQSPPTASSGSGGNKRSSPVGSLLGQHLNAAGWSTAGIFGGPGSARGKLEVGAQAARYRGGSGQPLSSSNFRHSPSMSSDGEAFERVPGGSSGVVPIRRPGGNVRISSRAILRNGTKRKMKIKSALHNQDMFDEDGYASVPLLDPSLEWKYRAYRASYARLLGVWGLHTQRAEVLKFDGLLGYFTPTPKGATSEGIADDNELALGSLLRRKTFHVNRNNVVERRGLEIRRLCNQCGEMLVAVEKNRIPIGWHCGACAFAKTRSSTRTLCAICTKSITGLMVPCLNCGHATCFECHRKWVARDSNINAIDDATFEPQEHAEKTCPTGCDCLCSTHQFVTVPYPPTYEDEAEQDDRASQSTARTLTGPEAAELMAFNGPDTAMGAFLSLARVRAASSFNPAPDKGKAKAPFPEIAIAPQVKEESTGDVGMNMWPMDTDMSIGLGAGLTRATTTLRERCSDTTIRKESEAEATLRRAGSMYD